MSEFEVPRRMRNRWHTRRESSDRQAQLYWHVLLGDDDRVRPVVLDAQDRIRKFPGLHLTPPQWLHLTVQEVILEEDLSSEIVRDLVGRARLYLQSQSSIDWQLNRVIFHPEAIAFIGSARWMFLDLRTATMRATRETVGLSPVNETGVSWFPHVTIAYSTKDQPTSPIVAALGRQIPGVDVTIQSISLVAQWGKEREWNWETLEVIDFERS